MVDVRHHVVRWLWVPSAPGLLLVLTIASCASVPASHHLSQLSCAVLPTPVPTPTTQPPGGHLSYHLVAIGPISLQNHRAETTWRVGDTMVFDWCPLVSTALGSAHAPAEEVATATLQGPFPSVAAANAARGLSGSPPVGPRPPVPSVYGPIVASATPIHTTTWAGVEEVSTMPLSTHLTAGYYLFVLKYPDKLISQPTSRRYRDFGNRGDYGMIHDTDTGLSTSRPSIEKRPLEALYPLRLVTQNAGEREATERSCRW
jgi:hypothetical protein